MLRPEWLFWKESGGGPWCNINAGQRRFHGYRTLLPLHRAAVVKTSSEDRAWQKLAASRSISTGLQLCINHFLRVGSAHSRVRKLATKMYEIFANYDFDTIPCRGTRKLCSAPEPRDARMHWRSVSISFNAQQPFRLTPIMGQVTQIGLDGEHIGGATTR